MVFVGVLGDSLTLYSLKLFWEPIAVFANNYTSSLMNIAFIFPNYHYVLVLI